MKYWIPGFCMIIALAAGLRADGQTTRPSGSGDGRSYDRRHGMGFGRNQGEVSAEEWNDISAFMKEHSPERLNTINALPDGPTKTRLTNQASREFYNLQRTRFDQPKIADLMTKRIELEDQVFKLAGDVKAEKAHGDSRLAADKQLLQQKVGELFDANVKERQARVDRLKETLAEQEKLLEQDKDTKNRDQFVSSRLNSFLQGQVQGQAQGQGQRAEAAPIDPRDGDRPTTQP